LRRRGVVIACALLALCLAALLFLTWLIQRYATFPRPPDSAWDPAARAANGGEQVWLTVDGTRVEAWFLPPRGGEGRAPLLIYSHGNAELIDMRADEFAPLRAAGIGVLQVEYPGYGRSQGSPSEESLTAALVAAYDWAARGTVANSRRIDTRRIIGQGRSLGGGAIAQLAARRPLAALVLESTFENFDDVVMGYGVPRWLLINHFDTRAVLSHYPGPVLLLHGTDDRVFASAHALALAAVARRATVHLEPCGHNDCPRQWELVLSFLSKNGVCRKPEQEATHEKISVC
jgi:fermentation-respiration switch protein FrsA (DUF1100 family)